MVAGGAVGFITIGLPGIGKAQSLYGSCHANFPVCFCIALSLLTILCDQLQLLYASWIASTPITCADAVQQERIRRRREHERQQKAEETAEDREQRFASVCCHS